MIVTHRANKHPWRYIGANKPLDERQTEGQGNLPRRRLPESLSGYAWALPTRGGPGPHALRVDCTGGFLEHRGEEGEENYCDKNCDGRQHQQWPRCWLCVLQL